MKHLPISRFYRNWYSPRLQDIINELTFNSFFKSSSIQYIHIDTCPPIKQVTHYIRWKGAMPAVLGGIKGKIKNKEAYNKVEYYSRREHNQPPIVLTLRGTLFGWAGLGPKLK